MRECYMLEVGVLLKKEDEEFEKYSQVYDKKHGYYDEYQEYVLKLENAKKKETPSRHLFNFLKRIIL